MPEQPVIQPEVPNTEADFAGDAQTDLAKERAGVDQEIARLGSQYEALQQQAEAANREALERPAAWTLDYDSELEEIRNRESSLRTAMKATHEDIHKLLTERGILENPDVATEVKDLRMMLFGGDSTLFKEVRNMGAQEFLQRTEAELLAGPGGGQDASIWQGKSMLMQFRSVIPPRANETVAHWTFRAIEETKKLTLSGK